MVKYTLVRIIMQPVSAESLVLLNGAVVQGNIGQSDAVVWLSVLCIFACLV